MQQIGLLLTFFIGLVVLLDPAFLPFLSPCFLDRPLLDNLLDGEWFGFTCGADCCICGTQIPHIRFHFLQLLDRITPHVEQRFVGAVFQVRLLTDSNLLDEVVNEVVTVEDFVLQDVEDVFHLYVLFKS